MKPLIIVNFKTYEEAQAANALRIAEICEKVARSCDAEIAVAPSLMDISEIKRLVHIPVFSQHIDIGKGTGQVTISALKAIKVTGTLINHSERQVSHDHIQQAVQLCKEHSILSIVCVPSPDAIKQVLDSCRPDYFAYEPPDLIGGKVSVTSAKPEIVKKAVELAGGVKVLCGAGIKNGRDVKIALELGCVGVLVASGVIKAENPETAMLNLAKQ